MYYKIDDDGYINSSYIPMKKLRGWQKKLTDNFRQRRLERSDEFGRMDLLLDEKTSIEDQYDTGELDENQMIGEILDLDY